METATQEKQLRLQSTNLWDAPGMCRNVVNGHGLSRMMVQAAYGLTDETMDNIARKNYVVEGDTVIVYGDTQE